MPRELTERQRRFVDAYTGESMGNATDAARRAGYGKPRQEGSRLLTNAVIAATIRERSASAKSKGIMDAEEKQRLLSAFARGEEGRTPIVTLAGPALDPEGKVMTKAPAAKDRIKAIEVLARMHGELVDKQEHKHSGEVGVAVQYFYPSNGRGPERGDG